MGSPRRIEQTSGDALALNYGTLYPALLKLEQEGAICASGACPEQPAREVLRTDSSRKEQLEKEAQSWSRRRRSCEGS